MNDNKEEPEVQDSDELYERHRLVVEKGHTALRIDKFLTNRLENTTRNKIQGAASAGFIHVNGKSVRSNYKVKPLDEIVIFMEQEPRELELIPENIPIQIEYEDDTVLIVNKKPGMVVHPAYGNYTGTLVNALAWHLQDNPMFSEADTRPGLVHRIDKNTSGLLVIAKTHAAKLHLGKQFFDHTTYRRYWALVWGNVKDEKGTITGNIGRNPKNRKQMYGFPDGESGKHAVTHYTVLERFDYVTLVECRLETGRTHQIRVHMGYIGHPLFNDDEYGGDQILKGTTFTKYKQFIQNCFKIMPRQSLHAKELGFVHPKTGENMLFKSELPADFSELLDKWRHYVQFRKEEEE